MLTFLIVLLAILLIVVAIASARKKKGEMSQATYSRTVSAMAVLVTLIAVITLFLRLRT
jgi:spore maturation protein SpmA